MQGRCNAAVLQGDLDDTALALLADAEMPTLDLAGALQLTFPGVSCVLQRMPGLRAVDLSFPMFRPELLSTLQASCPQLESLRLLGCSPQLQWWIGLSRGSRTVTALRQVLPRLRHRESVGESWEDAAPEDGSLNAQVAAQPSPHKCPVPLLVLPPPGCCRRGCTSACPAFSAPAGCSWWIMISVLLCLRRAS
jgi:hypothetical protein